MIPILCVYTCDRGITGVAVVCSADYFAFCSIKKQCAVVFVGLFFVVGGEGGVQKGMFSLE